MLYFNSIKELINTLADTKKLLSEMFAKRKSFDYKYEYAVKVLNEDKIQKLIDYGILLKNDSYLEIDEKYLDFFEKILEVNENINAAYIDEQIQTLKDNINYYLQEENEYRKQQFLRKVKSALRTTGRVIIRNIISLNRNINNTFKTEPNYKIKKIKLEKFDEKRERIMQLIQQTEKLLSQDELTFFKTASDDELNEISNNLQLDLNEARHNLIETQKQIIDYINQIEHQGRVIEQIRHVKYLKDQFELKTKTNVNQFLGHNKDIFFETRTTFPVNPALDALQEDQIYEMILQMNRSKNIAVKPEIEEAGAISEDYLQSHDSEQFFIDHETVKNQFVATRNNLFDFIVKYEFSKQIEFPERVGLFCQILSQYEDELKITNQYKNYKGVEYAIVLPK